MLPELPVQSIQAMLPLVEGDTELSQAVVATPDALREENTQPEEAGKESNARYVLIDALRGIAAIGVLLHHLLHTTVMEGPLSVALPQVLLRTCTYGAHGVQIFFVLSGFVIAHSLRNNALSRAAIKNFILRRQIRLDPPYWATIIFVSGMSRLEKALPSLTRTGSFHPAEVFLNFVYLQNIAGVKQVVGVAWTLCIEVQFYLIFILLLKIGQKKLNVPTSVKIAMPTVWLVFTVGICSLVFNLWTVAHQPITAWFIQYWFNFAAGVLCYWSVRREVNPAFFTAFLALIALSIIPAHVVTSGYHGTALLTHQSLPALMAGALTALVLYAAGRKNKLTVYGRNSVLQYFGRVSYSLYLVHLTVVSVVLRAGYKLTGNNALAAVFWFALAAALSIACGHLLHKFLEAPGMRFATGLKRQAVA